MNILLLSNSTNSGEEYLGYTIPYISEFLKNKPTTALFIPYAGVTISWDDYTETVSEKLKLCGIALQSIHHCNDKINAVHSAEIIIVGGGNTFNLLKTIQDEGLIEPIRSKVLSGTPYIGWSAGSNLACPTIKTTNDMPVVEPESFNALNLVPFQINPHYTDASIQQHAGETREMRIEEFLEANQAIYVAGLREGTMLLIEGESISLKGNKPCRIFHHGKKPVELKKEDNFSFLMQ